MTADSCTWQEAPQLRTHLQHRRSLDLDLFSQDSSLDLEAVRETLVQSISNVTVLGLTDATLRVRIENTPVDIVRYPYPPLQAPKSGPGNFPVADLIDLATMKLVAIARRGIRRDFWDLYEIVTKSIPLRDASNAYLRRFGKAEADLYHVFRALTYFDDADNEAVSPAGLSEKKWNEIKEFFVAFVPPLLIE